MKIALVSPYDFAYFGGVTDHISHLSAELQRRGNEVHIMAPCSDDQVRSPVPFHRLGTPVRIPANGSVARISMGPRLGSEVKQILASGAFDVVHLHEPLLPALPLAVLRASRATNVGTFHAYRHSNLAYFYAKPILQYFFAKLHGRIAVSNAACDFVSERFSGSYRVIPNGIDYERFSQPLPPLPGLGDGRPTVLFVGRLEKRKGLSYLLRSWSNVRREFPDARLVVVGGGGGLKHYRAFVDTRGSDDIVFAGQVADEDLPRYYQAADVFCAPSTGQESFGIVLLEAMAAGKPIVSTNIPGYQEVVTHGKEGLLVPAKDPGALGSALIHLLAHPDMHQQFGARGREKAKQFAWDRVADEVLDYYRETIHRRTLLAALRRPRFPRMRRVASAAAHLLAR
ncbi:MAG: glycosyl transferase group 1 [Chloroflexi bacterium]|nr:glycosyl transferase group 1 [Chloroflexota bacterium]